MENNGNQEGLTPSIIPPIPPVAKCYWCEIELKDTEQTTDSNGKRICQNCIDNDSFTCDECGYLSASDDSCSAYNNGHEVTVCCDCLDSDYTCCAHCEQYTNDTCEGDDGNYYCEQCRDDGYGQDSDEDSDEGFTSQLATLTARHQGTKQGNIIKSMRNFACEIECYYPNSEATDTLRNYAKEELLGLGISSDGSLNAKGIEYQTPILRGNKGERFIFNLCNKLIELDYSTNSTCGLHVHLDSSDFTQTNTSDAFVLEFLFMEGYPMTPKLDEVYAKYRAEMSMENAYREIVKNHKDLVINSKQFLEYQASLNAGHLKNLFYIYYYLDDLIRGFLPYSRRNNRYCKKLSDDFHTAELDKCYTIKALEELWYRSKNKKNIKYYKSSKYHDSRYHGANFHIHFIAEHFEVRYHSGTINPLKILHWTALHQALLDEAVKPNSYVKDACAKIMLNSKTEDRRKALYEWLKLPKKTATFLEKRAKKFNNPNNQE